MAAKKTGPTVLALLAAGIVLALAPAAGANDDVPTAGAMRLTGEPEEYRPALSVALGDSILMPKLTLGLRIEALDGYPVDRDGTRIDGATSADLLGRIGIEFNTVRAILPWIVGVEFETDLISGPVTDGPAIDGEGLPNSEGASYPGSAPASALIREASVTASYNMMVTLKAGLMTSQWGMGLLANDGEHGWAPSKPHFSDPRGGDQVLRGMLVFGPFETDVRLTVVLAADWVQNDDAMLEGDTAYQGVAALMLGYKQPSYAGLYLVRRTQEAKSGANTEVWVVDLTGRYRSEIAPHLTLSLEAELAIITGETELGPTVDFPKHDILQIGAAFRATLDAGTWGGVFDFLYASGDRNFDDGSQNAFKVDRNYRLGFLLFRHVMAGQTGRAPVTASDPELVGEPSKDLERLPTRGAISNTVALNLSVWVRPLDGLEVYLGLLRAFSEVDYADPFNNRINGGQPHNALGARPGNHLGTEIDLGVRYRALLWGSELTVGLEGGLLYPGDAMLDSSGAMLDPILGARFLLQYRL